MGREGEGRVYVDGGGKLGLARRHLPPRRRVRRAVEVAPAPAGLARSGARDAGANTLSESQRRPSLRDTGGEKKARGGRERGADGGGWKGRREGEVGIEGERKRARDLM